MRLIWVLFLCLAAVSGFLISDAGEALLVVMIFSIVAMPLVYFLMYLPAVTAYFGLVLLPVTLLRWLPWIRRRNSFLLFVLVAAVVGAGVYALPTYLNSRLDRSLAVAIARDMDLTGAKAPGHVVALHSDRTKCDEVCVNLLSQFPQLRLVLGRFDQKRAQLSLKPTSGSVTWGLVEKGIGECRDPLWTYNRAVQAALVQAELQGYCLERLAAPAQVDAILRRHEGGGPGFGRGQKRADTWTELFLRDGTGLRLAYRTTSGFRRKFDVPLVFFAPDFGSGLDLKLSLKPRTVEFPLKTTVPARTDKSLIAAILPDGTVDLAHDAEIPSSDAQAELFRRIAHARSSAALAALQSDDPKEIAKGRTIASNYMSLIARQGFAEADLPLIRVLISMPDIPLILSQVTLPNSSEAVRGAAIDNVLDLLVAADNLPKADHDWRALRSILQLAVVKPGYDLSARLTQLDQITQTREGREITGGMTAMRGLLGPDQATAVFAFLDARIADGEPFDGFRVALRGLCMMGPEGAQFLDALDRRESLQDTPIFGWGDYAVMRNLVRMGVDDDTIGAFLHFDSLLQAQARDAAHDALKRARASAEQTLAVAAQKGVTPPWRFLCE